MWLYAPSQSAPAPPDSNSDSTSLARDYSDLCVTVSAKPTPWKRLSTKSRQAAFPMLLSGLMSGRSAMQTAAESWAASTASLEATPASPSPSPGSRLGQTILDTFGRQSIERLASINRACAFSRTCQATLLSDSIPYSLIYERWATELRQACLRRRKLARATSESDCSSWPTAKTVTGKYCYSRGDHDKPVLNLEGAASTWPTAQAADVKDKPQPLRKKQDRQTRSETPGSYRGDLADHAAMWTTPQGMGNTDATGKFGGAGDGEFAKQANQWPTPNAQDCASAGSVAKGDYLTNASKDFPSSLQDPQTSTPGTGSSKSTRRLNPRFVEWLMNWPQDWTQCTIARDDCDYVETVVSPFRSLTHSCLLHLCS